MRDASHADVERLERELRDLKARLTEARRALPDEPVANHTLRLAPSGAPATLLDLFAGRDELILVHNMGRGCRWCTLWADGLSGMYTHLSSRATVVLTTPDEPAAAGAFAASRGWTFPIASFAGTSFAKDMGMASERGVMPGVSALWKDAAGAIWRTHGVRHFGPGDEFCPVYPIFDLLKNGPGSWEPRYSYGPA
jgi:predicted dithiol-disulfide oxidoreductase (DUF899 family)